MIRITFELEEFEVARLGDLRPGTCFTTSMDNPSAHMKTNSGSPGVCIAMNLHSGAKTPFSSSMEVFPLVADLTLRPSKGGKKP